MIERIQKRTAMMALSSVLVLGGGVALAAPDDTTDTAAADPAIETGSTGQASTAAGKSSGLQDVTAQNGDLSSFVEAVQAAGMEESLTSGTTYTIFAPTNEAYEASGASSDTAEPGQPEQLAGLLRAHIVADDVDPEMAKKIGAAKTVDGGEVELAADGEDLKVDDAQVVGSDIQVGNLRIYPIDTVLRPDSAATMASRSSQASPSSEEMPEEEEAEE